MFAHRSNTALALAKALKGYNRIGDPAKVFDRIHKEWPEDVAVLLIDHLFDEIKDFDPETYAAKIVRDIERLNTKCRVVEKLKRAPQAEPCKPLKRRAA